MECPICLEPITVVQNQVIVPCCKNSFHIECYLKCSNPCPLCRAENFISIRIPEPELDLGLGPDPGHSICRGLVSLLGTGMIVFMVVFFVSNSPYI